MNLRSYFQRVCSCGADRWRQLDEDPGLAAPWRQLFRQVHSPRHVLSELLQNADNAGARSATVSLAVKLRHSRFTEPVWIDGAYHPNATLIWAFVTDAELERKLAEWAEGPLSLLFFKNLHELNLNGVAEGERVGALDLKENLLRLSSHSDH